MRPSALNHWPIEFFLGRAHLQLGLAELQLGEVTEARVHLEASLPAIRAAHDWKYTGVALIGLGSAARAMGDAAAGALAYTEDLTLCQRRALLVTCLRASKVWLPSPLISPRRRRA
jgi:hypothetical protein